MLGGIHTKLLTRVRRCLRGSVADQFVDRQDGAAAVEFAIVAAPFLALLFAILETALVFFAGQVLESAAADSARLVMTGQAQAGGFDQNKFRQEVCNRVYGLFDCANGIHVDVREYSMFKDLDFKKPVDADGKLIKNFTFDPGRPSCVVVVRVFYEWPVVASLLGFNLADMASGRRLLTATSAFRNEPFANGGSTC